MKFKTIYQRDSTDCGAACLRMICEHYGHSLSKRRADRLCSATAEGVSLMTIRNAAESLGLSTVSGKVTAERLAMANLPCVLFWNQNHFVVLYHYSKGHYYVADPSKGNIRYDRADLNRHWSVPADGGEAKGIAMFFELNEKFVKNKENDRENTRSLKFLCGYLGQYRKSLLVILFSLLIGCVLQLIMPFLTQWIVDIGIRHSDIGFVWIVLLGEMMIVFGRMATDFIRRWLLLHISMRINISLVSDFLIKLLRLPMAFFDTKQMGDILQRLNDHSRIQSFLTTQVLNVLFSGMSFLIFGLTLFIFDCRIFYIFVAGSIVYSCWISLFLKRRKVLDYELFEQQSRNSNQTYQFITSMQEVKLQDCEIRRRWEWEDTQADLFGIQMKTLRLQQTQEAGSIFINETTNIFITVFAAAAVINGQITLGTMLAIQYIVGQLRSPVDQLMQFVYSLQDVKISLSRINEVHSSKDEESEGDACMEFQGPKSIDMRQVVFRYDVNALKNTIDDVSISIPEGKVTAIVGASGSGKTTLVKLMLGYYRVLSGEVSIAGRDINEYSLKWWRRRCGVVMQDGVIFSESIARNIAVGDGDIDFCRLEEAAKIACIHEYVMSLPLKYRTKVGSDGIGLSQGQKQRILIARAVYKNPDFIFLDEATNSLDSKNERSIVEHLNEYFKGRTVVVVAHRLSTVNNADQIIVLDRGRVVETGTHSSLVAKEGAYYNLVRNQLELGS